MLRRECEECGKPISAARLAAVPTATLCVWCKSKRDERPLRAEDIGDALAEHGELTPGEARQICGGR